jgi:hypothetical protein
MQETRKERGLRVTSKAFGLWKDKEKREGRRITIDTVCEETRLAKMTVRRFIAAEGSDVSGSPLSSAAVMADYFRVGLEDLLTAEKTAAADLAAA